MRELPEDLLDADWQLPIDALREHLCSDARLGARKPNPAER